MLKFLRKYQFVLLVVGGSMLMVVFLIQPLLGQLAPDPGKRIVARHGNGKPVTARDMGLAATQVSLVTQFDITNSLLNLDQDNPNEHWLLLGLEAERMGIVGVASDGDEWLRRAAIPYAQRRAFEELANQPQYGGISAMLERMSQNPQFAQQVNQFVTNQGLLNAGDVFKELEAQKNQAIRSSNLPPELMNRALARANAIRRLRLLFGDAPAISRNRQRAYALEQQSVAFCDLVFVGSNVIESQMEEPTQEQLRELFDNYGAEQRGTTETNEFGIGYRRPERLQAEWLILDVEAIIPAITPDPIEVRERWRRDNPAAESDRFEIDRISIENRMRRELAGEIVREADEILRGLVRSALSDLPRDDNGKYDVSNYDLADRPNLEQLAQRVVDTVRERRGITIPRPAYGRASDRWYTANELAELEPFLDTRYLEGSRILRANELPTILPEVDNDDPVFDIQYGIPLIDPPAQNITRSKIVYATILAGRPSSAPDSLDLVRDQVITDWKSIRAFEVLTERQDEVKQIAETLGMEAIPQVFDIVPGGTRAASMAPIPNYRVSRPIASTNENLANFYNIVMDAAEELDPTNPDDQRVVVYATPSDPQFDQRGLAVVRINALRPFALDIFRASEQQIRVNILSNELNAAGDDLLDPFSYEALKERLNFIPERGEEDEEITTDPVLDEDLGG